MDQSGSIRVLKINDDDNVAVALQALQAGMTVPVNGALIQLVGDIAFGHKFATAAIAKGAYVVKYGAHVGIATEAIPPGAHVHVHNVRDIVDEVRMDGRHQPSPDIRANIGGNE